MWQFTNEEKSALIKLAREAISYGLAKHALLPVEPPNYSPKLRQMGASFVTLKIDGKLRGCIGSLKAHRPLVLDVAHNAYTAAFSDPRFPPLQPEELEKIHIDISILSAPEPIEFSSEQDLLQKIRPNIDGLILSDQGQRGTFLPSVWESLKTPEEFLAHLKMKAGFQTNYWSDTLQISRYTTESISE